MARRRSMAVVLAFGLGLAGWGMPGLGQGPAPTPTHTPTPTPTPVSTPTPAPAPASAPAAVKAPAAVVEHWYEVSLGGKHAGYQHEKVTVQDGAITTRQTVVLVIKRGATEIKNTIESTVVETAENQVRSMSSRTVLGGQPIAAEYAFEADGVSVRRVTQGQTLSSKEKTPGGGWLSPAAAQKFLAARQAAGAKEITVTTIDPAAGLEPSTDVYTLLEQGARTVSGKAIKSWKYRVKAGKPKDTEQTVWLDEKANPIRSEMDLAGTTLVTMASTREAALRATEAPEIMVATFVKPEGKVESPRRIREATYRLRVEGDALPELPTTGTQTFVREGKGAGTLTVKVGADAEAPAAEAGDGAYLKATSWANSQDEEIAGLAKRALAKLPAAADDGARAEAIRAFVLGYISDKNLGSGFATASEVARTKSGDCTEHAVLTAAMLRAAGIPSRVASGLVYADQFSGERGVFAYHMWAQALIEKDGKKRWVELDATLGGQSFDATHLALVVTGLKDGEFESSMAPISKMLGRLKVEVVKTAE